ncbi:MAG: tetratricopeptide repeat protein [Fimbriiglobus sp.]
MAARSTPTVPTPNADQRRITAENYERARQVIATGNFDYGISLLTLCCQIDPGNFTFRRELRKAQKEKYDNNLRGSRFAFFSTPRHKARVKTAKAKRDYLKVLEHGEAVLSRNPWDQMTQMDMAEAFDALGLLELAIFTLDQARQKYPKDATLNRSLARLFEKRGDFKQAIILWQMVREANPQDVEAQHKAKDLAASETIAKGGYAEAAAGTKEAPILGKLEAQNVEKQDKLGKETAPLLARLEADPTEPTLYVQLATVYKKHQQEDRARAVLQQGLGPTGQHHSLQSELYELELNPFRKNLELTEAKLAALRKATDDDTDFDGPTEEELLKNKAKLTKEIQAREVSILRLRADRYPSDMSHRLELGHKLLAADKFDEAIAELQHARRDEKLKGRASLYLGICFRKRNNWRLAMRNFEDALQALPPNDEVSRKEALFQLAQGCAENQDLARAVDLGHELANIDFNYKQIGTLLEKWESQTGAKG